MDKYLRPSTLFRPSKFEGYLHEKEIQKKKSGTAVNYSQEQWAEYVKKKNEEKGG